METMQPTLKNGRNVWNQINMPKTEFLGRIKKLKTGMKKEGIDLLLIYGNALNEYADPCYLSNFIMWLARGVLAAVPKNGPIVLMPEVSSRELPFVKGTTWVEEIRTCGDAAQECVKYLKEKGLIPSTVGLVGIRQFMPNYQVQVLSDSLNQCKIINADHFLRDMRMVKSPKEVDQIRRSSCSLARTFDLISETSFPEMNERIVEAIISREMRLEGGEDFRILIAKPQETQWAFRPPEDTQIRSGDTVIIYLAMEFERYWAEGIKTFRAKNSSLEEVTPETVGSLYERLAEGMQPGKKLSQFYKDTLHEVQKSKAHAIWDYGMGQGIGLSLQELPLINKEEKNVIKEGMCLTLRLAIKDNEMGGIMIGNTFHVSKNGPEVLTR